MSQLAKLVADLRNNPKGFRFDDACKLAEAMGFVHKGGKGAHCGYSKQGEPVQLNFQNRQGKIKPYQARQLIEMIDKYWGDA
jgi:hypothetical protein